MNTKLLLVAALALGVSATAFAAEDPELTHRYSFDPVTDGEGNPYVEDSVGTADGTLYGGAFCGDYYDETGSRLGSALYLDGNGDTGSMTDGSFCALPGNIMTSASYSIETWAYANADNAGWGRVFDFGNCTTTTNELGEIRISSGNEYTMLAWGNGIHSVKYQGAENQLTSLGLPAAGDTTFHQLVYTYNAETQTGSFYLDGAFVKSGTQAGDPTTFANGMPNMWLGKSNWPDPYFDGTFAEFRIYDGVLSAQQIKVNNEAGPNTLVDMGELESITVSSEKSTIWVKEYLPITVTATYSKYGEVEITTSATLTSEDETVATVGTGYVRGVAAGSANIVATFEGKTATLNIGVDPYSESLTLDHRYSFDGNANDSVGGANGTLENGATVSSGMLVLAPDSNAHADAQYVMLPDGIVADYLAATVEIWVQSDNVSESYNWAHIWDFANYSGTVGTEYFYLTSRNGSNLPQSMLGTSYQTLSAASGVEGAMIEGEMVHIVVVADGYNGTYVMYRNGVAVATVNNVITSPMDMGVTTNNTIGLSSWSANPGFCGKVDEFRIWDGAMTAETVRLSYASGPDTLPPEDKGNLEAVRIVPRDGQSTLIEEAKLPFTVYGDYTNVKDVQLDINDVEMSSSNEAAVTIEISDDQGYLWGIGIGTSTITASVDLDTVQITGTIDITVTERTAPTLTHRYPFETDASDIVGGADGTLMGTAEIIDGTVRIDGTGLNSENDDTPHVVLPANLISDCESVTMETWVSVDSLRVWARVWDFGSKSNGSGTKYMFFAPYNGTVRASSANFVTTGQGAAEQCVYSSGYYMPVGEMTHVVVTVLADADLGRIYINGDLVVEVEGITNNPKTIGDMPYCYLGRSLYSRDGLLIGNIGEFRTWNGAMTAKEVAIDYVAGPDSVVSADDLGDFVQLRIEPAVPVGIPGTEASFAVYADYENMQGIPFNAVTGVEISIDNPAFKLLDQYTYTCNVAASGNIVVNYLGETYEAGISMEESAATLVHRYPFNDTAADTVEDVVGDIDGYNYGLTIEDGNLIMNGSTPVELPYGILSDVAGGAFSIESWMDIDANEAGNWNSFNITFFDFNYNYNCFAIGLQPSKGGNSKNNSTWALVELPETENYPYYKTESFAPKGFPNAGLTHVVYVIDPESQLLRIYINGCFENQVAMTASSARLAEELPGYTAYLGCSYGNVGMAGKMAEFRIWKGAMTTAQIAASYVGGPDTIIDASEAPDSLDIEVPGTLVAGATTTMNVYGSYGNNSVLLTSASEVIVTSSDEDVLVIDDQKRLVPVGAGTATVTAAWNGEVPSVEVDVIVTDAETAVVHRYSFEDGMTDSVGVADGLTYGNALVTDGQLMLDGGRQNYAYLPEGVISGLPSLSWEIWFTPGTYIGTWNRLLDFGDVGTDGNRNSYLFLSIYTGGASVRGATYDGGETYRDFNIPQNMKDYEGQQLHAVLTYAENGDMQFYLNGEKQSMKTDANNTRPLSDISDRINYIGRSAWLTDPTIAVSVDEFRIWNGVLDDARVALNYAAGPSVIPDPAGDQLESITVSVSNPGFYINEAEDINVIGHYSQSGDQDISDKVTFTVDGDSFAVSGTRITAISEGESTVTAALDGVEGTMTVTAINTVYSLMHRYSFDTEGEVNDSIGKANGTIYGDATVADGILNLTGNGDSSSMTDGSFVALPGDIMTYSSYTIETWARANEGNAGWGRVFDFGNCTTNDDGTISQGREYTMLAWRNGIHSVKYLGAENQITGLGFPAAGGTDFVHIVYTYDSATQTGSIYLDGVLVKSATQVGDPTSFEYGMANMWIGKSNWPDPYFTGDYEEFRIWRGAISVAQVAANCEAGPTEIGEVKEVKSIDLTCETEVILNGGLVKLQVIANYDTNGVDVTTEATLTSSDESILAVQGPGRCYGVGTGEVTVTATYSGQTDSVVIFVNEENYYLMHRYSFDTEGEVNDSIGKANGTIYGDATVADGILNLTGNGDSSSMTDGSFVALPGDIMTYSSYTIETWARANEGNAGWGRVFDFGNCITNDDGTISSGREYTMLAWGNGIHSVKYQGEEDRINALEFPDAGGTDFHHIVYTYDAVSQIGCIYLDGVLMGSATQVGDPTTFEYGMPNMWIGKSNWPDPYFTGDYEEFRIYQGALTAEQVTDDYNAGPNQLPSKKDKGIAFEIDPTTGDLSLNWSVSSGLSLFVAESLKGPWTEVTDTKVEEGTYSYDVVILPEGAKYYRLGTAE